MDTGKLALSAWSALAGALIRANALEGADISAMLRTVAQVQRDSGEPQIAAALESLADSVQQDPYQPMQ
jgi:hypothetical protein